MKQVMPSNYGKAVPDLTVAECHNRGFHICSWISCVQLVVTDNVQWKIITLY